MQTPSGPLRLGFGVIASLLAAGQAAASGFAIREQSAVGQGTSFAGTAARGDDPSMLFFNPASIAWLSGMQAVNVFSGIFPTSEATSGTAARAAVFGRSPITGTLEDDAGLDAVVPALYTTMALTDTISLGLGVTAPYGLVTKYESTFIGRYHALTSSLKTINIAPTIAWRPRPNVSLGASLQVQYADARLSNAVDYGAIAFGNPALRAAGFRPGSADGSTVVTGDDLAVGYVLGAQWEPLTGTRLGLSFRSAVFHDLEGEAKFESVPAPLQGSFQATGARAKLTTPETVGFGVTQKIGRDVTLLGTAEWTNWSRFRDLVVRFDNGRPASLTEERWRDSWFFALGAEYQLHEKLTLRAGAAYDMTPVREATRTPRIADADRYWLSIGATYQLMPNVALTAGYSHIFVEDSKIRLRDEGPGTSNFLRGDFDATYRGSVDIFAVQARFSF